MQKHNLLAEVKNNICDILVSNYLLEEKKMFA